ncbi:MAG TPA: hypothetical protein VGN57_13100 [Pirellulaceae bacterium]|nr:hypothetical protein [Pirellulaceae bacterium]
MAAYEAAAAHFERLALRIPDHLTIRENLYFAYRNLGDVSLARSDVDEAGRRFGATVDEAERLVSGAPTLHRYGDYLGIALERLGT